MENISRQRIMSHTDLRRSWPPQVFLRLHRLTIRHSYSSGEREIATKYHHGCTTGQFGQKVHHLHHWQILETHSEQCLGQYLLDGRPTWTSFAWRFFYWHV